MRLLRTFLATRVSIVALMSGGAATVQSGVAPTLVLDFVTQSYSSV